LLLASTFLTWPRISAADKQAGRNAATVTTAKNFRMANSLLIGIRRLGNGDRGCSEQLDG